jgi:predicted DNA-binding protein (UPF0251 family)
MNKAEAKSFITELARHGSQRRAASAMGLAQSTISGRFNKARDILGEAVVDQLMGTASSAAAKTVATKTVATQTNPALAHRDFIVAVAKAGSERRAAAAMGLSKDVMSERLAEARKVLGEDTVAKLMKGETVAIAATVPVAAAPVSAAVARRTAAEAVVEAAASGNAEAMAQQVVSEENRRLRTLVQSLSKKVLTDEQVRKEIFQIAHSKPSIPDWLSSPAPHGASDSVIGVPILFGSDWHWGEVVNPAEIGGVNEYNLDIARARLRRLIDTTIDLLTNHMVNPQYPGIVFGLGGDMVSGDIHDELSETNEMPIMPIVLDLVDHLYIAIKRLKEVFGRVFLPCVAGNHGRNTHKVRSKEFNYNSFDWLIYQQLDRLFSDDPDVVFFIPHGTDALVSIAGHKYLFSHGNQFRGGDGMVGALGPIMRGDHKKRGRNAQVGQEYDTLVIGHWHQLVQMKRVIVNGSLIGYNEYAYTSNFGYEPPQQALWVSHPSHGITFSMPVNVGEDFGKKKRAGADQPWVAFHEVKKAA